MQVGPRWVLPTRLLGQKGRPPLCTGGPRWDPPSGRFWVSPRPCYLVVFFLFSPCSSQVGNSGEHPPSGLAIQKGRRGLNPLRLQCRPPKGPGASIKGPWTPCSLFFCFCFSFCLQEGAHSPPGPRVQKGRSRPLGLLPPLQRRHPRDLGTPGGQPKSS